MRTRTQVALAIVMAGKLADLSAQTIAEATPLREVSVTATRVEQAIDDVPATVTTIDAQRIERTLSNTISDLIRYEPGVSVRSDPNRFGATGFNIRGLEDNRVLIQVDGVRVPDLFSFGPGPFNTSTRNLVDIDSLKRVEILRGPASSLYGSDALGGVVSYLTKDPADYLKQTDQPWFASFRTGYASADRSWNNSLTLAGGRGPLQGLIVYTRRDGHELETKGTNDSTGPTRTVANPQDTRADNILAKLVATPDANNTIRLTAERFSSDVDTNVLSLNSSTPRTSSLTGTDDAERWRVSLDHEYRNPHAGWLAGLKWMVFYQDGRTRSHTDETRSNTSATCSGTASGSSTCAIPRDFDFEQKSLGGSVQLESLLSGQTVTQRLVYGIDYLRTSSTELRDATIYNLTTGTVTKTLAGDTYPVRDFPDSDSDKFGVFAQDEILLADGRVSIIPGVRYDSYKLKVKPDATYLANTPPSVRASDFSDSAVSPKLGAVWRITPETNVFAQYAHGFRAPPFDDLNAAFRNPVQRYALIPNPNLTSETSRGVEAGVRGDYGAARFGASAFYNRYKDFIDTQAQLSCPSDPRCVPGYAATFQSINRAQVRIWGIEARGEYAFARDWRALVAIGYARGDDISIDQPLNSINPLKGVAGMRYTAPSDRFGGEMTFTAVKGKDHVDESAGPLFKSPGFAILDLTGYWNITKKAVVTAGLFNIFDRKYWLWSDLWRTALAPTSPGLERYTQPGRNFSVTFKYTF